MRRFVRIFCCCACALVCASACQEDREFDVKLPSRYAEPCLVAGGSLKHLYDASTWQELYSPTQRVFCVGNDTMSDYFRLTLSAVPAQEGQTLTGTVEWTSDTDEHHYSDLSWTVEEVTDEGLIWLWCRQRRIAAAVRVLQ